MSEEKAQYGDKLHPEPNKHEFEIGFDAADPEVMLIQVPVAAYAEDSKNGYALFYGKMHEAESIGAKIIREKRLKKAHSGVIMPGAAAHA